MIVRRERPHPGAQLSVFDTVEGMRHQVFITDSPRPTCSLQLLELRHRAHARVEDRIRTGKDSVRLLHVAARIVRTARRVYLRIAQTWPWANELATAYARLVALPRPAG